MDIIKQVNAISPIINITKPVGSLKPVRHSICLTGVGRGIGGGNSVRLALFSWWRLSLPQLREGMYIIVTLRCGLGLGSGAVFIRNHLTCQTIIGPCHP